MGETRGGRSWRLRAACTAGAGAGTSGQGGGWAASARAAGGRGTAAGTSAWNCPPGREGTAAGSAALDFITKNDLPGKAKEKGEKMKAGLSRIASGHKLVKEVRGLGLMLAMQTRVDIHSQLLSALKAGVIFAYSGRDTFRFLPALVIEESQISKGLEVLERVIGEEEASRF